MRRNYQIIGCREVQSKTTKDGRPFKYQTIYCIFESDYVSGKACQELTIFDGKTTLPLKVGDTREFEIFYDNGKPKVVFDYTEAYRNQKA